MKTQTKEPLCYDCIYCEEVYCTKKEHYIHTPEKAKRCPWFDPKNLKS